MGFTSTEVADCNKVRIWTPEMRAKVSASLRSYYGSHSDSPKTREKKATANRGKRFTTEHKSRIGEANRGRPKPPHIARFLRTNGLGQKRSLKARTKMSVAKKGKRCNAADFWENLSIEERRALTQSARDALQEKYSDMDWFEVQTKKILKAVNQRPNKLEKGMQDLLDELFPGEYRYVGDGQLILCGKCPDFANVNGQKKLIEVFGDYWHQGEDPSWRIALFSRLGFQTLVVWESELEKGREAVAVRLQEFHGA